MFQTQFELHSYVGEPNDGSSLTRPNMAMSISELMLRSSQGLPVPTSKTYYSGDIIAPDIRMQPIDKMALRTRLLARIDERRSAIAELFRNRSKRLSELRSAAAAAKSDTGAKRSGGDGSNGAAQAAGTVTT